MIKMLSTAKKNATGTKTEGKMIVNTSKQVLSPFSNCCLLSQY